MTPSPAQASWLRRLAEEGPQPGLAYVEPDVPFEAHQNGWTYWDFMKCRYRISPAGLAALKEATTHE